MSRTQLFVQRTLSVLFFGLIVVAVLTAPSEAAVQRAYAGIVVDAKTGKTLYSKSPDSLRYPASVTKVMTLYVLFQELGNGNLKLGTKMKVSKHAAAAVPTKLGLRAGSSISVEDAILALVTLSANDIARVIAEHISGSEEKFARRMTETARALGMSNTTYRNASGLPDSRQVTTVRDQARLGIAIYQHFPKYYEYFQTRSFKYGKSRYGNHNQLLGKYGIDGIKTGYINASGYNLLTAARQNGRHIVVAAFGYNSGSTRNAKVASLVNTYIPKARSGDYLAQAQIARPGGAAPAIRVAAVPVTPMPRPLDRVPARAVGATPGLVLASAGEPAPAVQPRPLELVPANALEATASIAGSIQAPSPQPKPINIMGAWISDTLHLAPETSDDGFPMPPVAIGGSSPQTIDLLTSGSVGEKTAAAAGSWVVQIGATPYEDGARKLLDTAARNYADLSGFRSYIEPAQKNGQIIYRARIAGFGDKDQAIRICNELKKTNMNCLAMQG